MKNPVLFLLLLVASARLSAQNDNLSNGLFFDGEPYLIINPQNANHLVIAWMGFTLGNPIGIKTRVSLDGGDTWTPTKTLPHFGSGYKSADPSMAFDSNGNLFVCYIDYREDPDSGGVYVL